MQAKAEGQEVASAEEAAAFAEKMPETAAELYLNDACDDDLAAADRLPARRSTQSSTNWRLAATPAGPGVVGVAVRRPPRVRTARGAAAAANGIDAAGRRVHRAFLASVRAWHGSGWLNATDAGPPPPAPTC